MTCHLLLEAKAVEALVVAVGGDEEAHDYRSIETHIRWVWARLSAGSARFQLGLRRWKLRKVIVMMRMTIGNSRSSIMMSKMMEKKVIKMRRFMKSENNK